MDRIRNKTDVEPEAFPYERYKETQAWKICDEAINDLVENHDITETTQRDYIVGYLCKKLEPLLEKIGS